MSRSYWRVSPAFWADEKSRAWPEDARYLALYLLTCSHRTAEGLFWFPIGYALADLQWTEKRFRKAFETLSKALFVQYDEAVQVCFLVNALDYQSPENPNQEKGAITRLEELPETWLLAALYEKAQEVCPSFAETLSKRFRNGFETLSKPPAPALAPTQIKHSSTEVDPQITELRQQIFDHWVEVMGKGGTTRLDDKRRKALSWALANYTPEECFAAIDGCHASDFHMGRDPKTGGKRFNELTLIFRDAAHVEEFRSLAPSSAVSGGRTWTQADRETITRAVALVAEGNDAEAQALCDRPDLWMEVVRRVSS